MKLYNVFVKFFTRISSVIEQILEYDNKNSSYKNNSEYRLKKMK